MGELVECTRCKNAFIEEEYEFHLCQPRMKECKIIKFANYHITNDHDDNTIIDIRGLDGVNFIFVEVREDKERTKISYQTPNLNKDKNNYKTPTDDQNLMTTC